MMDNRPNETYISDRLQPGLTMKPLYPIAPIVGHWGIGDKCATGVTKVKKIRGSGNISIGPLNVRTKRPGGKLEELTHEIDRYHWNIPGICDMRWKYFGEMSSVDKDKDHLSGKEDRLEYRVGFLVHKDMVSAAFGCLTTLQ